MKLVIVLFAVAVAVSAHPGDWGHIPIAPVEHPWIPAHPTYVKQVVPVHQAPVHHHVVQVAPPAPVPPLHPQPLHVKVPHTQSVRLPLHHPKVPHPHLIGYEVYHEPEIKVKPVQHHPW
ncbi:amelogenin, X isoform isoform X1 [Orussus abietinus]|uniref:amelogenin, X isoform isoform X1 n=1 Tax=Orussus abietinus TaxID=222816 RepID=UPI000625FC2E|nr:amelogenin, X isoform isoform X1 [Orussus abietinus]